MRRRNEAPEAREELADGLEPSGDVVVGRRVGRRDDRASGLENRSGRRRCVHSEPALLARVGGTTQVTRRGTPSVSCCRTRGDKASDKPWRTRSGCLTSNRSMLCVYSNAVFLATSTALRYRSTAAAKSATASFHMPRRSGVSRLIVHCAARSDNPRLVSVVRVRVTT
jgi:hypothetical protein